jgi:uncharacterized repeat protein (TIGR04052 family)
MRATSSQVLGLTTVLVAGGVLMGCGPSAPVTVRFRAVTGADDFSCTKSASLGTPATTFTPRDFRLYVHDVTLLDAQGKPEALALTGDGAFQGAGVVLLDFEDATGDCANSGTAATNTTARGLATRASSSALRFTFGVPFALDHADATAAKPPLNSTALWWSWQAGYKFLRLEGRTPGLPTGVNVHVGAVGCEAGAAPNQVARCAQDNTVVVTLDPFDVATDTVLVDLAALLSGSDLDHNAPGTAPGCMGSLDDPDCGPVFHALGLPFNGQAAAAQTFFRRQ